MAGAAFAAMVLPGSVSGQMLGDQPAPVERAPAPTPQQAYPPPQGYPVPAPGSIPTFESVMTSGYTQTSFTFDRTMLSAADGFFNGSDSETRRVVAGINSVSVRTFHARDFARYDPSALAFIDGQYRQMGWKHLVNANNKASTSLTDLWLHFSGANISNVVVLTRGDRNMSVISVDCTLRPLDLLHLSGHFGIPKVDENAVMVPAH
jgi:hypothetical protein